MENTSRYNLRELSSRTSIQPNKPTQPSLIMSQRSKPGTTIEQKLEFIMEQLSNLQSLPSQLEAMGTEIKSLKAAVVDMAESVDFMEREVDKVKENMSKKAEKEELDSLKATVSKMDTTLTQKFDELENRSRRNNLIFHGVPEVSTPSTEDLIKDLLSTLMGAVDMEFERIHRTGRIIANGNNNSGEKPRPIHVRFLRYQDREKILKAAPSKLKGQLFHGARIFVTDDVSVSIRKSRKSLREKLPEVRQKPGVKHAYIPWTVPTCINVIMEDGTFQRLKN